jgi:ankyrin repeat protein
VFGEPVQHMEDANGYLVGNSALWTAVMQLRTEEVRQLLLGGANIEERGGTLAGDLTTPLQVAVIRGHTDVVQLLLEHGADTSAAFEGETPLHRTKDEAIALLLFQHGADVSARNNLGQTPLHRAAFNGHEAVVKVLLENGSDVSVRDNDGDSPLHMAAFQGREGLVKVLLENGADVNEMPFRGMTALHWAAVQGYVQLVRVLIEHRANILVEDNHGYTAEYLATFEGHPEVVAILQEAAVTRAKCVAFAMGHHKRLGVGSLVAPLDAEVVRMVLKLVV